VLGLSKRNPRAVLALADDFTRRWPTWPMPYHDRFHIHARRRQWRQALYWLDRAVSLDRHRAQARFNRALFLIERKRYARAVRDLKIAERLDDGWLGELVPLYLAECHLRLGQLNAAEACCARVSDDLVWPPLRWRYDASKHLILADIQRRRAA
jgi:tetratricopeptide (TPR) repeat protein